MMEGRPMATSRFVCWQTKLSAISWAALVSPTWQLLPGANTTFAGSAQYNGSVLVRSATRSTPALLSTLLT